jgi:hypothetical protein
MTHAVQLVEFASEVANRLGYRIRHDWLGEVAAGVCRIQGQKWIFLDLADGPADQLAVLSDALRADPRLSNLEMPEDLARYLDVRKSA